MATYVVTPLQRFRAQEVRNVFYYNTTSPLTVDQLEEAADAIRAAWATDLNDNGDLVNDWNLYGVDFRRVDIAGLPGIIMNFTAGTFTGTATTAGTANQVALLVSGSAFSAKPRRARSYLAGFRAIAINDAGLFESETLADAQNWAAAMDEITVTGDTLQRVAAEFDGPPAAVSATNRLESYTVSPNPVIQRRRRLGSGI